MKIEKLAENKIMVLLTTADLSDMNMDISALENDSKDLHRFLFMLMERIKAETDFNPYGGQILMDAVPTEDNGVNIMVRKVHNDSGRLTREEFRHIKRIRPRHGAYPQENIGTEPFYIYRFDDVCMLLKELDDDVLNAGALYAVEGEYCFLLPKSVSEHKGSAVLYEFSHRRSYHSLQGAYIKEHGRLIAEGEGLLRMANGVRNL